MPRGGKRTGAGRKPGAVTRRTRATADTIAAAIPAPPPPAEGLSMLEIMAANARHYFKLATDAEKVLEGLTAGELAGRAATDEPLDPKQQMDMLLAEVKKTLDIRMLAQKCAEGAARYVHAPIAAVDSGKNAAAADRPIPLAERLKAYRREDLLKASANVFELAKRK